MAGKACAGREREAPWFMRYSYKSLFGEAFLSGLLITSPLSKTRKARP